MLLRDSHIGGLILMLNTPDGCVPPYYATNRHISF